ncbi:hypothetical protein JYT28_01280, partial [Desulfobulbus sp. AH-315-M07]|nr:hypothetical protein [Desulfobulbus sp. AH-315-M07]
MALEPAQQWTDFYYKVVEHYFWRPQGIGRMTDPSKSGLGWSHWREKLREHEAPLNHILDLFFHMAPQELLDRAASGLMDRSLSRLRLVTAGSKTVDPHIVQPDIILANERELVFIEMKVDSRSSIDQFAKYAIAAHCIRRDNPDIASVDLVMLSRHGTHLRLWSGAKKLGLTDASAVRELAARGLNGDS